MLAAHQVEHQVQESSCSLVESALQSLQRRRLRGSGGFLLANVVLPERRIVSLVTLGSLEKAAAALNGVLDPLHGRDKPLAIGFRKLPLQLRERVERLREGSRSAAQRAVWSSRCSKRKHSVSVFLRTHCNNGMAFTD